MLKTFSAADGFPPAVSSASRRPSREALIQVAALWGSGAEGSMEDCATMDHSDVSGSTRKQPLPQGHDSSGTASHCRRGLEPWLVPHRSRYGLSFSTDPRRLQRRIAMGRTAFSPQRWSV